jgi:PAS domain S-box-containing protein
VEQDTTTMDHTEGGLAERLRLLESALDAAQDAILLTSCSLPDNPIVSVNPAFTRVTGYAAEEVLGRNCRFLQGPDRDQPAVDALRDAVREGRAVAVTLRNYRKDGTLFWNELRIAPVRDAHGAVTHFVGVQNDVTPRVEAEQALVRRTADLERAHDAMQEQAVQLADATHARDRFMATVSHEMRTPINAVLGYADLLDLGLHGPLGEVQRGYVDRIRRTGRGLLELVNDVLDLTRAEFGHLEVELETVAPGPVLEDVVGLVESQARARGVHLSLELPGDGGDDALPPVRADRRRLRQVLLNLAANAVKFTDAGRVTVRARRDGNAVRFAVEDTGLGIAPEQLPLVFDEFFQGDARLTRRHGGAGLGLAISRRLAHLMGGELSAESELGRGSTFTLVMPVAGAAAPGAEAAWRAADRAAHAVRTAAGAEGAHPAPADDRRSVDHTPDADAPPVTVVVFGPEPATVAYLTRTLYPDVRLVHATDADAVAELARAEGAALVAIDVQAGDGVGWGVAHALRDHAMMDDLPLLILPATAGRAARGAAAALDLGLVAFAPKLRAALAAPDTAPDDPPAGDGPLDDRAYDGTRLARAVGRAAAGAPARRGRAGRTAPEVLVIDDDADARRVTQQVLQAAGAVVREAGDGETGLAAMRRRRPDVAVVDLMMPVLDGFGVIAAMRADARLRGVPVVVLTAKALTAAEREYLGGPPSGWSRRASTA